MPRTRRQTAAEEALYQQQQESDDDQVSEEPETSNVGLVIFLIFIALVLFQAVTRDDFPRERRKKSAEGILHATTGENELQQCDTEPIFCRVNEQHNESDKPEPVTANKDEPSYYVVELLFINDNSSKNILKQRQQFQHFVTLEIYKALMKKRTTGVTCLSELEILGESRYSNETLIRRRSKSLFDQENFLFSGPVTVGYCDSFMDELRVGANFVVILTLLYFKLPVHIVSSLRQNQQQQASSFGIIHVI